MAVSIMNLIHALVPQLRETQAFSSYFHKMAVETQALACGGGVQTKTIIIEYGEIFYILTGNSDIMHILVNITGLLITAILIIPKCLCIHVL